MFSKMSRLSVLSCCDFFCFFSPGVTGVRYPASVDSVDQAVFKSITQVYLVIITISTA